MCCEELPIEGFCVAAGIPTAEKAKIISGPKFVGIRHVEFKLGSVDDMVNIAASTSELCYYYSVD